MPLSRITSPFLRTNTSITSPAANTVAITTASTERLRVDSSGNVGIGTTLPLNNSVLDVNAGGKYFSVQNNLNGAVNPGSSLGLHIGWNRSAGNGETNVIYGTGAGAAPGLAFASWDGATYTERMRINSAGNVGIGTSSPGATLDASRSYATSGLAGVVANPQLAITNPSNYGWPTGMLFRAPLVPGGAVTNNAAIWSQWSSDNNAQLSFATTGSGTLTERMRIHDNGRVTVGTTDSGDQSGVGVKIYPFFAGDDPSIRLVGNTTSGDRYPIMVRTVSNNTWRFFVDYAGSIYAQNTSITGLSDARLKENIRDLETGLDTVLALKPRRFDWKEGKGQDKKDVAGFIAQEVEPVLPELVTTGMDEDEHGDKYKMLAPGMLIPTLVKAIQEQQAIINSLKTRIEALEGTQP